MEHDDVLEDLLSWREPSKSNVTRAALQDSCVNTCTSNDIHGAGAECDSVTQRKRRLEEGVVEDTAAVVPQLQLPSEISDKLYPHQKDGVQWLYHRHCRTRACLLADEMGLGKTIQVSVFLGQLYRMKVIQTTILVVPPTLIPMWEAALEEWGELKALVEVVHGDARSKRQGRWRKLRYGLPCVLLTTYGVLRQDASAMSASMVDYVILDEAHLIKDASTHAFKSALCLSARHKIALTGTPLMNTFDDMWSIFRFLDGSILEVSRANFSTVSNVLLRGNERDASDAQRDIAAVELQRLQAAIRPFMLRREKKTLQHSVTGSKRDYVVWVRLSEVQRLQYTAFLESRDVSLSTEADAMDDGSSPSSSLANPLLLLTMLSQICNHPWLSLVDSAFAEALRRPAVAPLEDLGNIWSGSKLGVALQLIADCVNDGRKTLVFSRSKRLLRMLGCLLEQRLITYTHVDGDISSDERYAHVNQFNSSMDLWACLLTTQVGGVGLTFTAASAVVLLDPSWNPSADAQAVDRVHRIGQTRDVRIFRLVTCGTVEEKVYRNQVFKRMAAIQSTLSSEQQRDLFRYFTRLQLRNMFTIDDLDNSHTAEQLELLHPGCVDADGRAALLKIGDVCGVSDNGCVLEEQVMAGAEAADALSAMSQGSDARKAPRSRSQGSGHPVARRRRLDGGDVGAASSDDPHGVGEEIEYLLHELTSSQGSLSAEGNGTVETQREEPPHREDGEECSTGVSCSTWEETGGASTLERFPEASAALDVVSKEIDDIDMDANSSVSAVESTRSEHSSVEFASCRSSM